MKTQVICINSDALNRNLTVTPLSTLERSLRDVYEGGMTMCIGHDMHRPIGWVRPFALYIEPKLTRMLAQQMLGENVADYKQLQMAHENHILKRYYESFKKVETSFLNLVGKYLSDSWQRVEAGCTAVYDSEIVRRWYPDLFDNTDDDGLISLQFLLSKFKYLGQGIFKDINSDLTLYSHKYFRRSQSIHNNFHFSFLDELITLHKDKNVSIKICLDEDMIGYAPSFHHVMEQEYHWGPKYTDDIGNIKYGITRHETTDFQRNYYGINRSEFLWKKDGDEMTFEMEELRDVPTPFNQSGEETYHCRYIHSIYNTNSKDFVHFDGAIRTYQMEDMMDRLDKNFLEYGRKAIYKKLFRIDGKLELRKWKTLVTHYLQGNPLIYEYFGEAQGYQNLVNELNGRPVSLERELVPFAIHKSQGLRLCISYHPKSDDLKPGRYIDIYDQLGSGEDTIYCTEHLVYEVKHTLNIMGEDLEIDESALRLKCVDRYWNIPSIMHNVENLTECLQTTKEAFVTLFTAMSRDLDIDVSFSWSFLLNDKIVRISSYGHITEQLKWLQRQKAIPLNEDEFLKWIEQQQEYLSHFEVDTETPNISIVQGDGVLFLKRIPMPYDYRYEEDDRGINFIISFPKDNTELLDLVNDGKVLPVQLMKVNKAIWSDTGEDYFSAGRSKMLEKGKSNHVQIVNWEPYHVYWSKAGNKDKITSIK